jgi:hypothetical protein
MSRTGVEAFDRLAKDSPSELEAFLDKVRQNGWIVKATDKLDPTRVAQFFPRKRRFYYAPERMTIIDMLHEEKHLDLFHERENWKTRAGQGWLDELVAYSYESRLGKQYGFSREYMDYLERRIEFYTEQLTRNPPRPSTMPDPFMKRLEP